MDILIKYKIGVNKRALLFLASIVWCFAGIRIATIGYADFVLNAKGIWEYLLISVVVFLVFFFLIFLKLFKKHLKRILSSKLEKHCIFSFFDLKGYIIILIMIVGGISLRNRHLLNPAYLGIFYIGLGSALLLSGTMFLTSAIRFKMINLT